MRWTQAVSISAPSEGKPWWMVQPETGVEAKQVGCPESLDYWSRKERRWQLLPPGIWGKPPASKHGWGGAVSFNELVLEATRVSRNAAFYVWSPLCLWITHPATLAQKGGDGDRQDSRSPREAWTSCHLAWGQLLVWHVPSSQPVMQGRDANFCYPCLGETSRSRSALDSWAPEL